MCDYIEFKLHERNFRYYSVDRIDIEKVNIVKSYWKPVGISNCHNYKHFGFTTADKKVIKMYLHRVIYYVYNQKWDIYDNSFDNRIDHKEHEDGIPLDNSIDNLRIVNAQQNTFNQNCKGFHFNKRSNKYQAQISVDGERKHLGYYDTAEEAKKAYLNAKLIYHNI